MKQTYQCGSPHYALLNRMARIRNTSVFLLPQSFLSFLIRALTVCFIGCDFLVIRSTTNLLFTNSQFMVTVTALVIAAILDVPMTIVGTTLKQRSYGQKRLHETVVTSVICILAFLMTFSLCAYLRIVEREALFSDNGLIHLTVSAVEIANDSTDTTLVKAIFMSSLPLATSLASLGIGYAFSDPIQERKHLLMKQQSILQAKLAEVDAILAECGDLDAETRQAETCEELLYEEFLRSIDISSLALKQKIRILLMEKMGNPDSITLLTQQAQALCPEPASGQEAKTEKPPVHWEGAA